MRILVKKILVLVGLTVLLIACNQKKEFEIDTSSIEVNIEIKRLDKDIFEIDPGNISDEAENLLKKYGEFFELYNGRIINLGSHYNKDYNNKLVGFITDYTMNKVYEKTQNVYPDLSPLEKDIETAFKRFKHYFPEKNVPEIYTYIGGFNQSIVITDSIIGIGLDKYLGIDCEYYDRLQTPYYLKLNMNPDMIPFDVLKAWVLTEFEFNDSVDNLLSNMIYQGKIQYFLDAMFPDQSDTLKMGFTGDQMRWCITNEKEMWNFLIDQKLLFSTDYMLINKHINPAPFTSGYPLESPGRASVWLGWKIVQTYMKRNSELTVQELMYNDNYHEILSESRYEP